MSSGYLLGLLRETQVSEENVYQFIQSAKSDLGMELGPIMEQRNYRVIPYGSAITGLFTNGTFNCTLWFPR